MLSNIVKVYDRKTIAVDDVSFEIADGEFFVLVGPSGCGKTTVLRLIAGLEELTSGSIYIGDRLVNDVAPKDRDIAMVFQNYALYPHMTAFENMAFGLKLRKVPKDEIRARVEAAAKILGIEHLLDRRPRALSGGERQRVAVGRAIVRQPKVFLFDEPLSNLDAKMRIQMRAELTRIHKQLGTTILYVTHDQVEAMTLGQRIGVMAKGKLLQIAGAMELYQRPVNRFVAGFIGSPPMNFIAGVVEIRPEGIRFRTEDWEFSLKDRWEGKLTGRVGQQLVAGIRPEDVTITRGPEPSSGNQAQVEVVEPMGNETLVYLRAGKTSLVARGSGVLHPGVGETVAVSVNTERLLFFDPETGAAL